jgi:hypothetical protein
MYRLNVLALALLCLSPLYVGAQAKTPAERLALARATYYTPTTDGLRTFDCQVSTNWKDFLTRANSGKDIADDNPLLKYLNSATITLHNALWSSAEVRWSEATPAPENLQESAAKMKEGITKMLDGYFKSWNAYLNGTMVPVPDKSTTISSTPDGIHLSAGGGGTKLDEDYDSNMLLTKAHVLMDESDVIASPTFSDTPRGRIISEVKSEVRQPPTAPPVFVTMSAKYQTIGGYEIPSVLHFEVRNLLQIDFALNGCKVN